MPLVHSIAGPVRHEIERIQASRFIASAYPVDSRAMVEAHLAALRHEFPKANHHCYAFRLTPTDYRSSDDGEPSGSAGIPILKPIEGQDLTRILVVVSRIFGGTKLGVGGLVRAYGEACREVLLRCEVIHTPSMTSFRIHHEYHQTGDVEAALRACSGRVSSSEYGAAVVTSCEVPDEAAAEFVRHLTDRAAGKIRIEAVGVPE